MKISDIWTTTENIYLIMLSFFSFPIKILNTTLIYEKHLISNIWSYIFIFIEWTGCKYFHLFSFELLFLISLVNFRIL